MQQTAQSLSNNDHGSYYTFQHWPYIDGSGTDEVLSFFPQAIDANNTHSALMSYTYREISNESECLLPQGHGWGTADINDNGAYVYGPSLRILALSHDIPHPNGIDGPPARVITNFGMKLRLENKWNCPHNVSYSYLKVHMKAPMPAGPLPQYCTTDTLFWKIASTDYTLVDTDTEIVELKIPQGAKTSPEYELAPPIVEAGMCHLVSLLPVEVAVDADRDGEITFDGKDKTTTEKPYRFWVNNDRDIGHTVDETDWEEDDIDAPVSEWDAVQPGLEYRRDLEDLTRVWIDFAAISEVFPASNTNLELKVRIEPTVGQPMINLFQPVEEDGERQYLQDQDTGYNQLQDDYGQELCRVTGATSVVVPRRAWENLPQEKIIHLLFEGANGGTGELFFELWDDGEKIFDFPAIHLVLTDVREMYETWTVGDVEGYGVQWDTWPQTSATQTTGQDLPEPETEEEKDYVLFIHGWNMEGWEKAAFADTMFKRMWHQGYKGRFGAFRWPTFWGLSGFDDWSTLHSAHYDGSEQRAWNSASQLASVIANRATTFKDDSGKSLVRCYAHSMGNVVTGEALRQLPDDVVHTYISAQAALPAHVWDNTTPKIAVAFARNTPNIYGFYWQPGAEFNYQLDLWENQGRPSYMDSQYMPNDTKYINHFNADDWALAQNNWQLNQRLKPDYGYQFEQIGISSVYSFTNNTSPVTEELLSLPNDRYRIFSFAAESWSFATGAEGSADGKFDIGRSLDLKTTFGFEAEHKGHSAQFRSYIQKRWDYWRRTLEDMDTLSP